MKTIVLTTNSELWAQAQKSGQYTQSTIDSTLADVGFIHATFPDQTIAMVNRKYADQDGLILLLVDRDKLTSPVKEEGSLSGKGGLYPHIYGPVNLDAVYKVLPLDKGVDSHYIEPDGLRGLSKEQP